MPSVTRRKFFALSGLAAAPAFLPLQSALANELHDYSPPPVEPVVRFFGDGEMFEPAAYLEQLQVAQAKQPIKADRYGIGGAVEELEKKFMVITGKEKAIYIPSGTLANQLADCCVKW